jgi:LuxR family maltose regulon positive regulatory protein
MLPTALSEAEIAQELYISYHTVHSHVRAIYRKLGTSSRARTVERARAPGCSRCRWGEASTAPAAS